MHSYYSQRAHEYERIYQKPERRADLVQLKNYLKEKVAEKRVYEVACGTGYFTEVMAETATSICASDFSKEVLAIAESKNYSCPATFERADMYQLLPVDHLVDTLVGGFIWSHVPREKLALWLIHLQKMTGAKELLFFDNNYVQGSSTPIARTDEQGNTYQQRHLNNGDTHEVLKNFPDTDELKQVLAAVCAKVEVVELEYYWAMGATL